MSEVTTIPSLESDASIATHYDQPTELLKFRYCSVLAQIEIASCFRNDIEPLFKVFDSVAKTHKPCVMSSASWADF